MRGLILAVVLTCALGCRRNGPHPEEAFRATQRLTVQKKTFQPVKPPDEYELWVRTTGGDVHRFRIWTGDMTAYNQIQLGKTYTFTTDRSGWLLGVSE